MLGMVQELGIRVPGDLAIIGFDNSPMAASPLVFLARIDQCAHRLGQVATEALLSRVDGRRAPLHTLLEPRLVLRRSIGTKVAEERTGAMKRRQKQGKPTAR